MTREIVNLPLEGIRITGGTQPRVETNEVTVAEYAEVIRLGGDLPPVIVFDDGAELWLADGFHRYHAHRHAGAMEIACDVRQGAKRDAILFSVGANAAHGLRRTNEDKHKAVLTLLNDEEWSKWSDREIARQCGVSDRFVNGIRSASANGSQITPPAVRMVERNGKTYEQNTANIGKKPADAPCAPSPAASFPAPSAAPMAPAAPMPAPESTDTVAPTSMHDQIAELQASLKETLADNEMMGRVFDADDRLKAAMDEAKRQKAIADSAERTLAAKNGEFVARAQQVTYWKNRATKAEAALARAIA